MVAAFAGNKGASGRNAPGKTEEDSRRSGTPIADALPVRCREKTKNLAEKIAEELNITQPAVSKMECEQNVGIETLKKYAGGMGGELILTVSFPGGESYRIG